MTKLEAKTAELRAKSDRAHQLLAKKTADGAYDITPEERDEVQRLNAEMKALGQEVEQLRNDAKMAEQAEGYRKSLDTPFNPAGHPAREGSPGEGYGSREAKTLGDIFIASAAYKGLFSGGDLSPRNYKGVLDTGGTKASVEDYAFKTVFSTSAGWDPFVTRLPGFVASAQQMPRVVDVVPVGQTTQHSIKYMLETTYTNAAAETAEGSSYPESALALTEELVPIRKIAAFLPVTDEQLQDEPQVRDYLNNRLDLQLRQRLDSQLVAGNGSSPNLTGFTNVAGIQTTSAAGVPTPDAIYQAITDIRTGAYTEASAVLMHPSDWQSLRTLRASTGQYLWGDPSITGVDRIWGLPIVTTTYVTQGTAIVGDFANYSQLFYRKGIDFLVSNSHSDFFARGQLAIRADLRCALVVTRPAAICTVTNLH
jgi:hypothetical protein